MSIDWGTELDRVEKGTQPISQGVHTFRIVDAKAVNAQSGNRMIKLTCKVEGGPDDGKLGFHNVVFAFDNPRAMKMTLRRLKALGVSEETLKAESPSVEQIAGKLIGRGAQGTVTHRDYLGEPQSDIDFGTSTGAPNVPAAPSLAGGAGVPNIPSAPATPDAAPPTPVIEDEAPAAAPAAAPTPPAEVSAAPSKPSF